MNSMFDALLSTSKIFAASTCKCVDTLMFGKVCSDGSGNGIFFVLSIVVQILTVLIGILATIGILFFGFQYLTTGDKVMKNYGCLRTSYATVLRSFGANVTPADFAYGLKNANALRDRYAREVFGSIGTARSNLADKIWNTLTAGGAVIIRVHAIFTGDSHHMPIIDYRVNSGKREVYVANPGSRLTGWHTLDKVVNDAEADYAYLFRPKTTINCRN